MNKNTLLIIGLVWPEPTSSAAGTRMVQLVNLFISKGYTVFFACAASKSDFSFDLNALGVTEKQIKLNDPGFNLLLKELDPGLVLFDRFMIEEQYGWRVCQECPDALRILDTEDLHCLRHARHEAIKANQPPASANLFTDLAKREIAAILRSDLTLMISEAEMNILQEQFRISPDIIFYLPFLEDPVTKKEIEHWASFNNREGFVFIGNYLHEPNWHTLQILKTKIWPVLRKKMTGVNLHIYGAYPAQKVMQLHNEKERFYVHGRAHNAREAIARHRVLLAPILFGAGVKGKFIDAMQTGTPSVTTSIGAEAMKEGVLWNGIIANSDEEFIAAASSLYQDEEQWEKAQQNGVMIVNKRYAKQPFINSLMERIEELTLHLKTHREQNFFGQILLHHTANSTKYMSLWIEEKNTR